ncbi:hypothetical protein GCM10010965_03650 [Caldalkalibacillus thermarum]|uniref:DUF421 domain-containing protein n=1 Tax=Caldalkalibacillus thermarum TaxID=296745 RepID=UPI001667AB05|nr:DUF421 domain-containing protein [Caldalkalibacillus thermarum]GGK13918.1 hypothetical protein GCM10010965_03650 [Caldalkalibacillus thermarum]
MQEWLIIILRTAGLFALLLLAVPLLGRKPVSGMTWFDYIVGLVTAVMIALVALNVVQNLAYGLIGLFIWFLAVLLVQYLVQKSKWAHDHFYGKEIEVIKNGKVLEENLQSARMTGEELLSQLRRKNIFQVSDVEFAVMEANGDITALLKREKQPLTPMDMRLNVSQAREPQTVILDGKIMDEPLTSLGLNREWLFTELKKIGVNPENVFIGQVDSMGELYLDLFDDAIQLPQPKAKALLLATLKKVEADLLSHALETQNQEWRRKYQRFAKEIKKITEQLEPHLTT